jgi:hypothetical protein
LFIIALLLRLGRIAGARTPAASHHYSSVRETNLYSVGNGLPGIAAANTWRITWEMID